MLTSTPLSMRINWCFKRQAFYLLCFSLKYVIAHVLFSYCRTLLPLHSYDIQNILPSKMHKYAIASPSPFMINKPFFLILLPVLYPVYSKLLGSSMDEHDRHGFLCGPCSCSQETP